MTAVKQTYSRDFKIAVDTLRIGCEMTGLDSRDIDHPPNIGAFVYGLFMEGGRFNRAGKIYYYYIVVVVVAVNNIIILE